VISDARWEDFCEAIELPTLALRQQFATNAQRVANRAELERLIAEQTARRPVDHWLGRLRSGGLLAAPLRTVGQTVDDPATRELGLFVELTGYPGVLSPRLDVVPGKHPSERVPALGEDTK